MRYYITLALSFLIFLPAILGWVRRKMVDPSFFPFLIVVWLNVLLQIFSAIISHSQHHNLYVYNIYILAESLLMLWLFKNWRLFKNDNIYLFLGAIFVVLWVVETSFFTKLFDGYNSYFQIFYSFTLVLMSISVMNEQLMKERASLTKNSNFIICGAVVLYNTLALLTETFYAYGLELSLSFQSDVLFITTLVNVINNLLYALAIKWMPRKKAFTLEY